MLLIRLCTVYITFNVHYSFLTLNSQSKVVYSIFQTLQIKDVDVNRMDDGLNIE